MSEEREEELLLRLGRLGNFDDSDEEDEDDESDDDDDDDSGDEVVLPPLLRRRNAVRRPRRLRTIEDSFVAYQNPFVEVTLRLTVWLGEACVRPLVGFLQENIVWLLLVSVASFTTW